jgi:ATP-dependent DNA helicase RecQ
MLRGARTARTERFGFTTLSTFGLLVDRSQEWVVTLLRGLMAANWIDLTPTEHPVPFVTPPGWAVMKGTGPVRFRLPREPRPKKASGNAGGGAVPPGSAAYDPALFERLRAFRAQVAKEKGVPAYVVALDRTLYELSARRPSRLEELPAIHGLGPARIEAYGAGLLRVLRGEP